MRNIFISMIIIFSFISFCFAEEEKNMNGVKVVKHGIEFDLDRANIRYFDGIIRVCSGDFTHVMTIDGVDDYEVFLDRMVVVELAGLKVKKCQKIWLHVYVFGENYGLNVKCIDEDE